MKDGILWMNGIECCKCWRPAEVHDFTTGFTHHVSRRLRPCQVHEPRPHLSNGGDSSVSVHLSH